MDWACSRHFSLLRNLANGVLVKPLNVRPQPRQRYRGNPFALPHKITSRFAQCGHPMPTTRRWPTSATEPNPERLGFGGAGGSTEPSNSGMIVEFRSVTAASMAQPNIPKFLKMERGRACISDRVDLVHWTPGPQP